MSLPYFPVGKTDFKISMGLQALKEESWIETDAYYKSDTDLKHTLLNKQQKDVLASLPGSEQAQQDILDMVHQELDRFHPTLKQANPVTGQGALAEAASLIQEDLVLMQEVEGEFKLTGACICFPSGWNLREKVGHSVSTIHLPVPDLNASIGNSIDRFFEGLNARKKVQRFNWGIFDDDALFQPEWKRRRQLGREKITLQTVGEKMFFRVEKQTLQRLKRDRDTLFTVRIFNTPLEEVTKDQERAANLLHTLKTMPDPMRKYKAVAEYEDFLLTYLEKRACP
ncbi:MAG: DUF3445 domain-containing protein [Sneathiellales bacterium]|nr:DUF3445 domain-containing protein [Sneathiellales bacterium]